MIRVQIQGTTIFGYVQENYKELKLLKVAFLDEETKDIRRVDKRYIRVANQKERYN
tara:strand:+ start:576 stop:743 length:168 start_codon:yes stop_codon:yes gene_type:complete